MAPHLSERILGNVPVLPPVSDIELFHLVDISDLCDIHEGGTTSKCFELANHAFFQSLPSKTGRKRRSESPSVEHPRDNQPTDDTQPLPISNLLNTYSVMVPIVNYGVLVLLTIGLLVLLPLFYSSSIEIGGLGSHQPPSAHS